MEPRQVFASGWPDSGGHPARFRFCPRCGSGMEPRANDSSVHEACRACGYVHYHNPLPGVVVLVQREGLVLLGKRAAGSFHSGAWCLPGGFIEWSEDFLTAARREVREETGLEVRIGSILSVVSNFLSPSLHTLVVVLLAHPVSGALKPADDVTELAWHPLGGPYPELAFEADRHIIQRYAETHGSGAPVDPTYSG